MEITYNTLYLMDCLDFISICINQGVTQFIKLFYIDAPFNSNRDYNLPYKDDYLLSEKAFNDTWSKVSYLDLLENEVKNKASKAYYYLKWLESTDISKSSISYLTFMSCIYWGMQQLAFPTASFYHHVDPTMSGYLKQIQLSIFGSKGYSNEISWKRTPQSGGQKAISKSFGRSRDVLLFWTMGSKFTFHPQFIPFTDEYIKDNYRRDPDGTLWQPVMLQSPSESTIARLKDEGRFIEKGVGNKSKYHGEKKIYITLPKGSIVTNDWNDIPLDEDYTFINYDEIPTDWSDIPSLTSTSKEKMYATQKPKKLVKRVILTSSDPGDLIADIFVGGGTTPVVAAEEGRNFIGVDLNPRALNIAKQRLEGIDKQLRNNFNVKGAPRSSIELRNLLAKNFINHFEFQDLIIKFYLKNVIPNEKKTGDGSIDGFYFPEFEGKKLKGLVQVTSTAQVNHLKAFCSEIGKGNGDLGIYIAFANTITDGMKRECKIGYGKLGGIDKVQILTVEEIVDERKEIILPSDTRVIGDIPIQPNQKF